MGKYFLDYDTIKPTIKKIGKNKTIDKNQKLGYLINDEETGIKKYKAISMINGLFLNMNLEKLHSI